MRQQGWTMLLDRFPEARLLWKVGIPSHDRPDGNGTLRAYSVNGCVVLVHDYNPPNGWQMYTPVTESGEISKTLDAVGARTHGREYDYRAR